MVEMEVLSLRPTFLADTISVHELCVTTEQKKYRGWEVGKTQKQVYSTKTWA